MPGSNLTRIEAEERKAVIEAPIHYHVDLDLTVGAKNFGSKSFICFNAKPGSSTFLDLIADEVTSIDLNGKSLDPAVAFQDNRIELTDLKGEERGHRRSQVPLLQHWRGPAPLGRPVRWQHLPVLPVRGAGRSPRLRRVRPA